MYMQCGMHICSGAYANNVKCMHTSASCHIVDCSELMWVYAHELTADVAYMSCYVLGVANLSQLHEQSGHPNQHCRSLLALTWLHGPCCLVLQFIQVGSILLMAIQANKSYKNWSSIGKHCVIIENSKLNKHSHLIEYSWQTQCLDALKYTKTVGQDPYPLKA